MQHIPGLATQRHRDGDAKGCTQHATQLGNISHISLRLRISFQRLVETGSGGE
ncbi:predicted protein [Plenodomus lingam JN3]|uniref:Predicted protein n=1 Tax=Leptosphaeria maculans (strain JN3 / isolate v23.1.3 / race Av1-4-5-6-7-8) TaxID=985895 RepID=E5A2J5_LEPMJ|nr:predicted protein [Plenodomus lingam JN3]CBX97791.1 predicted protein [Plenodomus lingam JN3]